MMIGVLAAAGTAGQHMVQHASYHSSTLFDDQHGSRWSMGDAATTVRLDGITRGWTWRLDAGLHELRSELACRDDGGLTAVVRPDRRLFDGAVAGTAPGGVWQAQATVRVREHGDNDLSAGLTVQPLDMVQGSIQVGRRTLLPSTAEIYYDCEGGTLDVLSTANYSAIAVAVTLPLRLQFATTARWAIFAPPDSHRPENFPHPYQAALSGLYRDGEVNLDWQATRTLKITAQRRSLEACARIDAYTDGRRFAHFGRADLSASEWSTTAATARLSLVAAWGQLHGELGGSAQAWPFVDGLARFLGERRQLMAEADLRWYRGRVEQAIPLGRTLVLNHAVDFAHLVPDARYVTWRALALGMGIDDLRAGQIEIKSADLARLTLSPAIQWHWFRFSVSVSQILPLHVSYHDSHDTGGSGGNSGGSPSTDSDHQSHSALPGFSVGAQLQIAM